jgi:lysozyme family protein
VLRHEGGYTDDNGNPTNWGISKGFLHSCTAEYVDITTDQIKSLSKETAIAIYKKYFWDKNNYSLISNQKIAEKVFDLCVNTGQVAANKCLQRALNVLDTDILIAEDGVIGTKTIQKLENFLTKNLICRPVEALLGLFNMFATEFYLAVCEHNPNKESNLLGWLMRLYK